jgi:hypothetical protein
MEDRMKLLITGVALGTAALATNAVAQAPQQGETGYRAIAAGDLVRAERDLTRDPSLSRRPELMLNLAALYLRSGRPAEATALYRAVLDRRAVDMDMPSGAVRSSHSIAQAGLALLALAPQR